MQKNNSTVKKSKNVSRNALQIIIQELSLSDAKKVKLLEDLRSMGITDDNDPLVKFTMLQGLLAQYNGETAEKVVRERENIEESVEELEELRGSIYRIIQQLRKKDLAELKDSIKLWKNEAIIGTQKVIVELRYEEERLRKQNKKQEEELHKSKEKIHKADKECDEIKNSCTNIVLGTVVLVLFSILIGVGIISLIWNFEKNSKVEKYSDTVETSKPVLKIADNQSEADYESELDLKYKKYREELENEPDMGKRLEMLKKMLNIGEENK